MVIQAGFVTLAWWYWKQEKVKLWKINSKYMSKYVKMCVKGFYNWLPNKTTPNFVLVWEKWSFWHHSSVTSERKVQLTLKYWWRWCSTEIRVLSLVNYVATQRYACFSVVAVSDRFKKTWIFQAMIVNMKLQGPCKSMTLHQICRSLEQMC